MSDSLQRLHAAILDARFRDPADSRTAKLFADGLTKMAKKVAEEAVELGLEAVQGRRRATIRESADLIYNLAVLWAAAGVSPQDVWDEMDRRERMLGMAEKLPKSGRRPEKVLPTKASLGMAKPGTPLAIGRPVIALETRRTPKRR